MPVSVHVITEIATANIIVSFIFIGVTPRPPAKGKSHVIIHLGFGSGDFLEKKYQANCS